MSLSTYDFSFGQGPGDWVSWLSPSLITGAVGTYNSFTRLQAPGELDPNHIDGIGPIWLVSHLSSPTIGAPGALNLTGATINITIKATDFVANGAKLYFWIASEIPESGITEFYYVGLQGTNWAFTGEDLASQLTNEWQTLSVTLDSNPANWTYAGNNVSNQGDWGKRYEFLTLPDSLAYVDQTLHLVLLGESPDQKPTGFLDIANISVTTLTPALPLGLDAADFERVTGIEDQVTSGILAGDPAVVPAPTTYTLIAGSERSGSVTINPTTGAYSFTPTPDFYGATAFVGGAEFQYTVSNGTVISAPIHVVITIAPINDAPETFAFSENVTGASAAPLDFSLRRGFDVDGDTLSFHAVAGSVNGGTLALDAMSGRYTFTPTAGFSGTASFGYVVSDGQIQSAAKTVQIAILANPPPLPTFTQVLDTYLIPGDYNGFVHWAIRLAELGDPNAAYHYGTWLHYGDNITEDTATAALFLAQAVGTVEDASIQLAALYVSGSGVVRDYAAARALLTPLTNNAEALYRLALLEGLGFGAPVDLVAAAGHLLAAAERGHADAMYTLGRRYLAGEGVAHDATQAYFWLELGLRFNAGTGLTVHTDLIVFNAAAAASELSVSQIFALDLQVSAWISPYSPSNPGGITLTGNGVLIGGAFNDRLTGGNEADTLLGLGGNDVLSGGAIAANTLQGGTGDDTYIVELVGDTVYELADEGTDTVILLSPELTLREHVENLTFAGTGNFTGTGNASHNLITGGAGDDILAGLGGNNRLVGGAGIDTADYASAAAAIKINLNSGTGTNGYGGTDTLSQIENINGTALADTLIGNSGANILTGGLGADYLLGLGGNDRLIAGGGVPNTLQGGTGDDVYVVELSNDTIIEFTGEGIDRVESLANTATLRNNVENLTFVGTGNFVGSGNSLANVITGGTGADYLIGNDGDDILFGGTGAANTLQGGIGNDIYVVSTTGDSTIEFSGGGIDTVQSATSHTLSNNVENLIYTGSGNFGGTGNSLANSISGGAGKDTLNGLGGDDILTGGAGTDQFRFSSTGLDRITDFVSGVDRVGLANAAFSHTASFVLIQGVGVQAATAAVSTFLYNKSTGLLSFDADGSGGGAAVTIATLNAGLTLAPGDFLFY